MPFCVSIFTQIFAFTIIFSVGTCMHTRGKVNKKGEWNVIKSLTVNCWNITKWRHSIIYYILGETMTTEKKVAPIFFIIKCAVHASATDDIRDTVCVVTYAHTHTAIKRCVKSLAVVVVVCTFFYCIWCWNLLWFIHLIGLLVLFGPTILRTRA